MEIRPLNIFYEEPDPDRWIKFDHYPRKLIRYIIRGKPRPGGVMMVALELMRGLDKLNIPYRFNDYRYIKKHPDELVCIIGKPHVLFSRNWINPILFGAGIFSHPVDCPDLLQKYPNVKKVLVPGEWVRKMFEPYYLDKVQAWPVGIDTTMWAPLSGERNFDFLIYDKINWEESGSQQLSRQEILTVLNENGCNYHFIKYGHYTHKELRLKLSQSRAVIFLCKSETQGLAYQQILATDTPVLAWDEGGYWKDPAYYPDKVRYQPVSSVPYWSEQCGEKFSGTGDFEIKLRSFMIKLTQKYYTPRKYILDNLTLEKSASDYLKIVASVYEDIANR